MNSWVKYMAAVALGGALIGAPYFFPTESLLAFAAGWFLAIPLVFILYLIFGLLVYMKSRKNRITISMKPSEAIRALARRETQLKREKEILYEELRRGLKNE
jgi:hypothetical protein